MDSGANQTSSMMMLDKSTRNGGKLMSPRLNNSTIKSIVTAPKDSINSSHDDNEFIKLQDVTANQSRLDSPELVLRSELYTMKILVEE